MALILHITSRADWEQARMVGLYAPPSLQAGGFIHFSTPEQVLRVANAFYRGRNDLALLVVDADRLTSRLVWEAPAPPSASVEAPPAPDETFPHLYGPLNLDAVTRVLEFSPGEDGTFALPELT